MKPMGAVAPELDAVRDYAVPTPVRGTGDILTSEASANLFEAAFECFPGLQRARLIRRPRSELRIPRPRREITIGIIVVHAFDGSFDPHLAP